MNITIAQKLWQCLLDWLNHEPRGNDSVLCDFDRLAHEIRPGDVLLVESRSRVGDVIKTVTRSPWTHAALYIGRLYNIEAPALREHLLKSYQAGPEEQLLVEALLGQGVVVSPLKTYSRDHLRICRPQGLDQHAACIVINHAVRHISVGYNIRQLLDLARFLFPFALLPRRWQSSLFNYRPGIPTRTVCSTMIAEAFMSANYPILPILKQDGSGRIQLYQRNPRLFCPCDFDYSPYFDIIKYPFYGMEAAAYKKMPWNTEGLLCDDKDSCYLPVPIEQEPPSAAKPVKTHSLPAWRYKLEQWLHSFKHLSTKAASPEDKHIL